MRRLARLGAAAAVTLTLAACVTDGLAPRTSKRDGADPDKPRAMCEATSVAGEPKTVCY